MPIYKGFASIFVKSDYTVFVSDGNGVIFANLNPAIITKASDNQVSSMTYDINAFPNPASESITIEFTLHKQGSACIRLYSMTGKEIMTIDRTFWNPGTYSERISTIGLTAGVYILHITNSKEAETRKIVIL